MNFGSAVLAHIQINADRRSIEVIKLKVNGSVERE
jgi:hypothetical protein